MERIEPLIFKYYPNLKSKVPWIPLLTNVPTPIEGLIELEKYFNLDKGHIYIKRDDKNHQIYGGNKIRKFEFIFGNVFKKKKKAIVTYGGIGTNHGLACLIICNTFNPPLKCDLFLFKQPLTWHVQRMLLLYKHFGANLHFGKTDVSTFIKAFFFWIFHRGYEFVLPGGSPLFGRGTPLGIVGFIEAIFELKEQINKGQIVEPDVIFVAGSTTGTAAGLVVGCKLLGLKTRVYIVAVYKDFLANSSNIARNANKALKYLHKKDKSFPKIEISAEDFELITGYLGTGYGVKTIRGQKAVDTIYELEGRKKDFQLETTYTGKAMAALFDFLENQENKSKTILFWNTNNSNNLDIHVRHTQFNYKKLPKKFQKFFEETKFQCWQITDCPDNIKKSCPAYLNHEYRFWKVTECLLDENKREKAFKELQNVIELEDA
jgi:1-aminocyclopropane-1-carboxylate deaminase/D-cysteine desulfhydrase-like pyridoxal-dependent ACC family enzyme